MTSTSIDIGLAFIFCAGLMYLRWKARRPITLQDLTRVILDVLLGVPGLRLLVLVIRWPPYVFVLENVRAPLTLGAIALIYISVTDLQAIFRPKVEESIPDSNTTKTLVQ